MGCRIIYLDLVGLHLSGDQDFTVCDKQANRIALILSIYLSISIYNIYSIDISIYNIYLVEFMLLKPGCRKLLRYLKSRLLHNESLKRLPLLKFQQILPWTLKDI